MKILLSIVMLVLAMDAHATQRGHPLTDVLLPFVDDDGLVDYATLKADRKGLDAYCDRIADLDPTVMASQPEAFRVAFWINAYNAFTLKLIVDNYPIKPSTGKTKYPANSIRQIPGAWEHKKFKALGKDVTLDEIEHKILRAEFKEPRIHMALVCAAMSCPKLRREPYQGDKLDAQLDDQARMFLADLTKFHIDREANEVWASRIFEWFVDDFLPGATKEKPLHVAQQKSLAAFASKYVSPEDAAYLQAGKYVVKYFEYDWTLNEQAK
jgi:hypothetical protein